MKNFRYCLKICIMSAFVMTLCIFTYKAFFFDKSTIRETNTVSNEEIRLFEEFLQKENYYNGDIDGKITVNLVTSAKEYCKDKGIEYDGTLTYEIIKKITEG